MYHLRNDTEHLRLHLGVHYRLGYVRNQILHLNKLISVFDVTTPALQFAIEGDFSDSWFFRISVATSNNHKFDIVAFNL